MTNSFPGYDVLAKRRTPSWNEQTRAVIDRRLAVPREPRVLTEAEFATLGAICDRIVPQPADRPPIPVAALIDDKLHIDRQDGYRAEAMPRAREAWRRGLAAIEAEARAGHGTGFGELRPRERDALLRRIGAGEANDPAWAGMPPATFFKHRLLPDIVHAYWSHPTAWSEIGWGGPASPRGYVRMGYDERDPWEAAEAYGDPAAARRRNRDVG